MRKANNKLLKIFGSEENAIKQLSELNQNQNITQIANKFGILRGTVSSWFKRFNIEQNETTFKNSLTGRKLKKEPDKTIITKEYLSDLYYSQHKTQSEIAKITGITKWTIQTLFSEYNIEPRKPKNRFISKEVEQKLNDKTWLHTEHHTNKKSIAEISRNLNVSGTTLLKRFDKFDIDKRQEPGNNIWSIFKNEEEAHDKLKILNNTLSLTEISQQYNLDVGTVSLWFKKFGIIPKIHFCSKEQKEIFDFISQHEICTLNDRTTFKGTEIDIYVPTKNFGIELDGLYWHNISKLLDINYHKKKTDIVEKLGKRLLHIYDTEWNYKKDIVKSMIMNYLGKTQQIYARETIVKEIDSDTASSFYNENHIQGNVYSKINLGLFYNAELVSMMSFSKNRFSDQTEYELTRFCNKLGHRVVGGASKLFSYFIKTFNPESILSYADRRYSNGSLYYKLNFQLKKLTEPGYSYVINGRLESRQQWQKHKLSEKLKTYDPTITEEQNMSNNGYHRIYNCGNMAFVWSKPEPFILDTPQEIL